MAIDNASMHAISIKCSFRQEAAEAPLDEGCILR